MKRHKEVDELEALRTFLTQMKEHNEMSIRAFASRLGIGKGAYENLMLGKDPSIRCLRTIAKSLNVSLGMLLVTAVCSHKLHHP